MAEIAYKGKITKTGNSKGIRFDASLFKAHPEFLSSSEVTATVISKGVMLVSAEALTKDEQDDDPVIDVFLGFLENQLKTQPNHIKPVSQDLLDQIGDLVEGVEIDD